MQTEVIREPFADMIEVIGIKGVCDLKQNFLLK